MAELTSAATIPRASRFSMLPGETPQEPARLDHPSFAAAVEAVRALLEIAAAYQVPAALLRNREPSVVLEARQ